MSADAAVRIPVPSARLDLEPRAVETLAGELAWCLDRFVNATADEVTMKRAQVALRAWRAAAGGSRGEP